MGAISPILTSGLGVTLPGRDTPEKIHSAATQFESLLLGQVLKSMHEDGEEGWLGSGEDQTAASAMSLADEYLAQAITTSGGLGLAQMIERQLATNSSSPVQASSSDSGDTPRTDP